MYLFRAVVLVSQTSKYRTFYQDEQNFLDLLFRISKSHEPFSHKLFALVYFTKRYMSPVSFTPRTNRRRSELSFPQWKQNPKLRKGAV